MISAGRPRRRACTPRSQVRWFRPTWSSWMRAGSTPAVGGEPALEADRDVAQPDRVVSGVEQRARDDADRVGEVDDPAPPAPAARPGRPGRARPARCAAPWPGRRRRSSPGRRSRTPAAASRPRCARPARRPAAGSSTASAPSTPSSSEAVVSTRPGWPCLARIRRRDGADRLPAGRRPGRPAPARDDRQLGAQPGEAVDELGRVGRAAADDWRVSCSALHSGQCRRPRRRPSGRRRTR